MMMNVDDVDDDDGGDDKDNDDKADHYAHTRGASKKSAGLMSLRSSSKSPPAVP